MTSNYTLAVRLSEKEFVYRTGVRFRGLTISQTEKGWNVVIRGFRKDHEAVYALVQHEDAVTGLEILLEAVAGTTGLDFWHPDRYYRPITSS